MNLPRPFHAGLLAVTTALAVAHTTGCRHPQPLSHVPREGKFEKPVLEAMVKAAKTNGLVSVVATLGPQLGDAEKRRLLLAVKAASVAEGVQGRRKVLIEELKRLSLLSQQPVLARLSDLEKQGAIRAVRPLWIANAIAAQVSPSVISNLAAFDQVISLHLDLPVQLTPQAVPFLAAGSAQAGSPNPAGPEPSLEVLVAVLDSGVDRHHSDLANRMWVNPGEIAGDGIDNDGNGYVDDLRGWNFSAGSNDPDDINGHGTHVAGIVAGDGSGGGPGGVAPQARIMALRRTDESNRSTERECWEAMQYALENGARILNCSSGWLASDNPGYKLWRNAVQNLTDAGVLFVTAAGNFGNVSWSTVPNQVLTPGRVPAALTVGWSTGGNAVSQKSSRGPVSWKSIQGYRDYPYPPGLIKPDLVAPGEQIQSTRAGGGYIDMSGTSMAAPHVAGAAALLLGQNPGLNPYELRYLLEESASGFANAPRPNPVSGWGHLNAPAALALAIDPTPFDLFVTNLHIKPPPVSGQRPLLSATLTNLGGQVVGNAEIRFYTSTLPQCTVADLDPNGDGVPDEGVFTHAGSYFVPVLGPGPSGHGGFEGVVRWTNAVSSTAKWMGVWVLPGATSGVETRPLNNGAVVPIPAGGF